jgi:hypothetical protein
MTLPIPIHGVAIVIAGSLCLAAILISMIVDLVYKNKKNFEDGYECGFDNRDKILFCDTKQPIISYFLVFELAITVILVCSLYLISNFIGVYKISILLFLFVIFSGMVYYSKNYY